MKKRMNRDTHANTPWGRIAAPLWLAVWFGLLTGLLEAGHFRLLLALEELPLFIIRSNYAIAAPLVDMALFAVVGLVFTGLHWYRPGCLSLRTAGLVFTFLCCWAVVLHVSTHWLPIHTLAELALSVGLAVQISRLMAASPGKTFALLRWTTPVMLLVVAVLGFNEFQTSQPEAAGAASMSERPVSPHNTPNVILIVMDTVRAKSLSLYGCDRATTPHLEQLALRGVVFERAVSPAPWTLPSHASMFTGWLPHDLSADWCVPLNDRQRTLAEELRDRGYATGGFIANVHYCGRHTGLDRGFDHYAGAHLWSADTIRNSRLGKLISHSKTIRRMLGWRCWPGRKEASHINAEFLTWLSRRDGRRPYFAFLNYFDAHAPYVAGDTQPTKAGCCYINWFRDYSDEELERLRTSYEACIRTLDEQIGQLINHLEDRGELDNTLIVITSDHGEQFGEHGLLGHNNSLYRPLTHVPLIVIHPSRISAGLRIDDPVSLRDLPATILDFTDADAPGTFPGTSLARYWQKSRQRDAVTAQPVFTEVSRGINVPDRYPNAHSALRSVWVDKMQYIRRVDTDVEELFSLRNDPDEDRNLVDDAEAKAVLKRCRALLKQREQRKAE